MNTKNVQKENEKTEEKRRFYVDILNNTSVKEIKQKVEKTWTTEQLQEEFIITGFMAPYVVVCRKSDGARGTLMFKHNPRIYFSFEQDDG